MFNLLKSKISNWAKSLSKKESKPVKTKKIKKKSKEIKIPKKFNPGTQKYEPELEKIPEVVKESKKEKSFFQKITSKISNIKISKEDFKEYEEDLELILLENNVALEVTEKIIQNLEEKIIGKEIPKKEIESYIKESLKEIIEEIIIDPFDVIKEIKKSEKPYVILFCGINGSGKTTTIAKFADKLKKENLTCVLAAGDTFRAAAIDQIKKHGENLSIPVIAQNYETDPASVGFEAIQYAKKSKKDVVLIDTAGRMHSSKNLMQELEKIARVCKPNLKLFVGESITGNDATEQARTFNFAIQLNGIILSKADIDEKGGTALSIGYVTKKPILFLGTGQEYSDLEKFDKKKFIESLGL